MAGKQADTKKPMRDGLKDFTFVVLVFCAVSGGLFLWIKFGSMAPATGGLKPGVPAPAIQAAGWLNGEPPAANDLAGKVVVLDAWATWCLPCRVEAAKLKRLHNRYRNRGVVFIGLTDEGEDSLPRIEAYLRETGTDWLNGYGAVDTLDAFEAEAIPRVWVIDSDGIITWSFDSREPIEEAIERAIESARRT